MWWNHFDQNIIFIGCNLIRTIEIKSLVHWTICVLFFLSMRFSLSTREIWKKIERKAFTCTNAWTRRKRSMNDTFWLKKTQRANVIVRRVCHHNNNNNAYTWTYHEYTQKSNWQSHVTSVWIGKRTPPKNVYGQKCIGKNQKFYKWDKEAVAIDIAIAKCHSTLSSILDTISTSHTIITVYHKWDEMQFW